MDLIFTTIFINSPYTAHHHRIHHIIYQSIAQTAGSYLLMHA